MNLQFSEWFMRMMILVGGDVLAENQNEILEQLSGICYETNTPIDKLVSDWYYQ